MIIESIIGFAAVVVISGLYLQFMPDSFGAAVIVVIVLYLAFLAYLYYRMKRVKRLIAEFERFGKEGQEKANITAIKEEISKEDLKEEKEESPGREEKKKGQLRDYVRYNLKYGKKKEDIVEKLVQAGWEREKVESIVREECA